MALGGGNFTTQNKVLPGAYINFVSLNNASASFSDRGIATMPLELDWGVEGEVFEVSASDFARDSLKIFGYNNNHKKMKGLRDLFKNINTLYAYRLNGGVRGNDVMIVIQKNVDDETAFDVMVYLDTMLIDKQTAKVASELVDNDFVTFNGSATLNVTAGLALSGGANGTVDGTAHQTYLDKIESSSFNTMGVVTTDDDIKYLYTNFCKRMRDEVGAKFQVVLYNKAADHEGVINVNNKVTDDGVSEASLVYWVTGVEAGCAVNKSTLNRIYDGEFAVDVSYTQAELESAITSGKFTLHKVGSDIRILDDVNSLTSFTETKGEIFKENQTIRVIDQVANDMAVLFNTKYLGNIPNDESGRASFRVDVVKHHKELQNIR